MKKGEFTTIFTTIRNLVQQKNEALNIFAVANLPLITPLTLKYNSFNIEQPAKVFICSIIKGLKLHGYNILLTDYTYIYLFFALITHVNTINNK